MCFYTHIHTSFYSQGGNGGEAKDTEVGSSHCVCSRGVSMADRKGYTCKTDWHTRIHTSPMSVPCSLLVGWRQTSMVVCFCMYA